MPVAQKISQPVIDKIRATAAEHKDWSARKIAKELGLHNTTVLRYLSGERDRQVPEQTMGSDINGDAWAISLPRTRIHTLEELIEFCKIDLGLWEVERFIANKWEVAAKIGAGEDSRLEVEPLYQIKAFLRKRKDAEAARDLAEEFIAKTEKYAPKKFPAIIQRNPDSGVMAEFAVMDHHFGAHIWGKETGGADYDLTIQAKCYRDAFTALIPRMRGYRPEIALLVVGNDQQNADNKAGTTEKGTPQDMDSRYQKVTDVSYDSTQWAIDVLLGEFGRVHVVVVGGNHDPLTSWHLGKYLSGWYRNCKAVTIDNAPTFRKYFEYGVNMLMWTHGNAGKLEDYGKTMAAEQPAMWGRTLCREAHTGDKHHRRLIELKGAAVRILPPLRPPDAWSSENHFIGALRAAEAYAWSKTEGLIGTAMYSILEKP